MHILVHETVEFYLCGRRGFLHSSEDELGAFAQYYGLPWLSFRAVTWHEHQGGQKGYTLADFLINGGGFHPSANGHGYTPYTLLHIFVGSTSLARTKNPLIKTIFASLRPSFSGERVFFLL